MGINGNAEKDNDDSTEPETFSSPVWRLPKVGADIFDLFRHFSQSAVLGLNGNENEEDSQQQKYSLDHVCPGHAAHSPQSFIYYHNEGKNNDALGKTHLSSCSSYDDKPNGFQICKDVIPQSYYSDDGYGDCECGGLKSMLNKIPHSDIIMFL